MASNIVFHSFNTLFMYHVKQKDQTKSDQIYQSWIKPPSQWQNPVSFVHPRATAWFGGGSSKHGASTFEGIYANSKSPMRISQQLWVQEAKDQWLFICTPHTQLSKTRNVSFLMTAISWLYVLELQPHQTTVFWITLLITKSLYAVWIERHAITSSVV